MTTTRLPRPIAAYIAAVNLQDIDAVTASFSEEAVVHDEGQTRRGIGTRSRGWGLRDGPASRFFIDPTEFADRRALVTGGTQGMGEAI